MINTSLIITVFNRSQLIRKSLLSLQNQSVMPSELILSDDGSSEDILGAIKDIIKNFNFPIKYVRQENKGFRLAKTRNNGVKNSNGEFLIFLDQDLIHTKNLFKTFVQNYKPKRFITGMPIWLDEQNSKNITEDKIINYNFLGLLSDEEKLPIEKQFKKDRIYYILHKFKLTNQPRLRGGVCAINRKDFDLINGYDEKFVGWGSEDDDLAKRLYATGAEGFNPFRDEYTIHFYHEKANLKNKSYREQSNYLYYQNKKIEITNGKFRAEFGMDNPFEDDKFEVIELN